MLTCSKGMLLLCALTLARRCAKSIHRAGTHLIRKLSRLSNTNSHSTTSFVFLGSIVTAIEKAASLRRIFSGRLPSLMACRSAPNVLKAAAAEVAAAKAQQAALLALSQKNNAVQVSLRFNMRNKRRQEKLLVGNSSTCYPVLESVACSLPSIPRLPVILLWPRSPHGFPSVGR
jgi:hypothetical protein